MIPNAEQIALAEQISQTVQHLLELQFRYNSAAPISKLPPELLSQIFVEHVAQAYEHWKTLPDDIRSQSRSHWFYQFSHVCRRWRNTSLNCEKIWTYIVVDVCSRRSRLGQFSVERLLERSKGPTLAMAIMCGHSGRLVSRSDILFKLACQQFCRTRELYVDIHVRLPNDIVDAFRSLSPTLRKLELINLGFRFPSAQFSFLDSMPYLVHLVVEGPTLNWTLSCATLRHLDVTGICSKDHAVTLVETLSLLKSMPMLESLSLAGAVPNFELDGTQFPTVDLPNLRALTPPELPGRKCAFFLRLLSFPKETSVTLRVPSEASYLTPWLSSYLTNIAVPIRGVTLTQEAYRFYRIRGWTAIHTNSLSVEMPNPVFDLTVERIDEMNAVLEILPLSGVHSTCISQFGLGTAMWIDRLMLGQMQNLSMLRVCGQSAEKLAKLLCIEHEGMLYPLLPHLRILVLDRVQFGDGSLLDIATLVAILRIRQENKTLDLERLSITRSKGLETCDTALLSRFVQNVCCDGSITPCTHQESKIIIENSFKDLKLKLCVER